MKPSFFGSLPMPSVAAMVCGIDASLCIIILSAVLPISQTGCSAADRATAGTVISDIGAVAGSPVPCNVLSASGVKVGTACGAATGIVSDVAQLISTILGAIPDSAGMRAMGEQAPPVAFGVRGVTVTLPKPMAEYVLAHLGADAGAM